MFFIVVVSTWASILGLRKRHPQNEDELEDVVEGCFHELKTFQDRKKVTYCINLRNQ